MRILLSIGDRFALNLALVLVWTRWYLLVNLSVLKYFTSFEITVSFLWIFHVSVRLPLRPASRKEQMKSVLPNYR